ncbi:hypothetical protein HaLaN_15293 [Haematococcus lacustris]|uniref:Uncharacterized protein n=1 Tax=Haematococcus lacustris TaxID=44745 RepID=A0A699Z746_HAELA|nr:hypothetical protein HaLaN_15293 [Haematococcus lacustris]
MQPAARAEQGGAPPVLGPGGAAAGVSVKEECEQQGATELGSEAEAPVTALSSLPAGQYQVQPCLGQLWDVGMLMEVWGLLHSVLLDQAHAAALDP